MISLLTVQTLKWLNLLVDLPLPLHTPSVLLPIILEVRVHGQYISGPQHLLKVLYIFQVFQTLCLCFVVPGTGPLITRFGINGDGLDRDIRSTYERNLLIHCGTPQSDVQIDWYSPSGEKVGITNRNLREAHYNNGTTVLQIATFRRLSICDAGVYTCVANNTSNRNSQRKNFILIIGSKLLLTVVNTQYYIFL